MLDLDQIVEQAPPTTGKIMHLIECLMATGEPLTLSINGRGNLPNRGDGAIQMLFTLVERLEVTEMHRERLAELDAGGPTFSRAEAMEMIKAKHELSV